MTLWKWSRTASSNSSADATINWVEGQPPSSINDSARAMMAAAAKYRDDIAGAIATGGTSTAYTVSSYQGFDLLAHLDGQMIAFTPHAGNGATVTLNVDGLGARPLRAAPSIELQTGSLIQGTPYVATYSNSDAVWYLQGAANYNTYSVPLAGGMPYFAPGVPNSAFALPYGQAISRTTYATLFAIMGATFGNGDGSTTFNLPDLRGRVVAGLDNMGGSSASRLADVMSSTSMGATGGADAQTLNTNNLPPYTPSGSVSAPSFTDPTAFKGPVSNTSSNVTAYLANGTGASGSQDVGSASTGSNGSITFTGTAQGGITQPFGITQPTMVANFIIRII